ncbi:MAG: hypothetical protein WDM77_17710 [Steroidobacteraceae bacterium]
MHAYTGLPEDYLLRSDLRVNVGQFMKTLQGSDTTTGRLDSRFSGPTIDPMSREADYDPQSAAIQSAYVSAFNDYVRTTLGFGQNLNYKIEVGLRSWDYLHQPPDANEKLMIAANVMPDLANAMKTNPNLKVQLNSGYYDLATPFFEGMYEMSHLPSRTVCARTLRSTSTSPATWFMRMSRHWRNCTRTSRHSSAERTERSGAKARAGCSPPGLRHRYGLTNFSAN